MRIHHMDGGRNYATRFQQTISCNQCRRNHSKETLTRLYAYSCGVISNRDATLHDSALGMMK